MQRDTFKNFPQKRRGKKHFLRWLVSILSLSRDKPMRGNQHVKTCNIRLFNTLLEAEEHAE